MDFICILNSYVRAVGTDSLRRHLSLNKHMDIGCRQTCTHTPPTDTHTWMMHGSQGAEFIACLCLWTSASCCHFCLSVSWISVLFFKSEVQQHVEVQLPWLLVKWENLQRWNQLLQEHRTQEHRTLTGLSGCPSVPGEIFFVCNCLWAKVFEGNQISFRDSRCNHELHLCSQLGVLVFLVWKINWNP